MKSQKDQKPITRRRFIAYAWIGAAAIVVGELIAGTLAFLWPRRKQAKGEAIFIAGKATEFKKGEVYSFRTEKAYIVRTEDGFLAISAVCTHLRCVVNWNEKLKRFECPCHGAKFNQLGEVIEGPPPRPLNFYQLQVVEEKLVLDLAHPIERKKFEPSQIVEG